MALDTDVLPAVAATLQPLVTSGVLKGVEIGSPLSIPETPWAAIQAAGFESVPHEATQEPTEWTIQVMLYATYAPDQYSAEMVIAALIEPIRTQFRAHIKLGKVSIAAAWVHSGTWGYVILNGVDYRYVELNISVREKVSVSYSA